MALVSPYAKRCRRRAKRSQASGRLRLESYSKSGRSNRATSKRIDRPRPGTPLDEAVGLQCDHHLMHRRRRHFEVVLHVGLGRGVSVNLRVVEDKRQILSLLGRERLFGHCARLRVNAHETRQQVPGQGGKKSESQSICTRLDIHLLPQNAILSHE